MRLAPPVNRVAEKRVADRGHVHAHLVCPAGLERAFDERGTIEDLEPLPVGDGPLAASTFDNGDLLPVTAGARERRIDDSSCALRQS